MILFIHKIKNDKVKYRYANVVEGFDMPIQVAIDGDMHVVQPTTDWKTIKLTKDLSTFEVDRNFYVDSKQIRTN